MSEDEENRKDVLIKAVTWYFFLMISSTLIISILHTIDHLLTTKRHLFHQSEKIATEILNNIRYYPPRYYIYWSFYIVFFIIQIFLIVFISLSYTKKFMVNEERRGILKDLQNFKDKRTRNIPKWFFKARSKRIFRSKKIEFFQSIKIFPERERLKNLSEANQNDLSVQINYWDLCRYSLSVTLTIVAMFLGIKHLFSTFLLGERYSLSAFGFSILSFQLFFYIWDTRLLSLYRVFFISFAAIITIIYVLFISGQLIYRNIELDMKFINDVSPLEQVFRYGKFITIILLVIDFFDFIARTVDPEIRHQFYSGGYLSVFFDAYWYFVLLGLFIFHLFLTFTLVNVCIYLGEGYRSSLKHAAMGLLELSGEKNIYFGLEAFYREHTE